jgi:hypothetical protein
MRALAGTGSSGSFQGCRIHLVSQSVSLIMRLESLDPTIAPSIVTAHAWLPGAEINLPTFHGMKNCQATLVTYSRTNSRTTASGVGMGRLDNIG